MVSTFSTAAGTRGSIEPAGWRDLNDLRRIGELCFPKDMWPLWDLIAILTFPNVVRRKACFEGHMVGFIGVDLRRSQRQAWVATLCVHPQHRRRGIATALLLESEEYHNMPHIRLSVRASNQPAINLYAKFGYHDIEMWPSYYQDGEDALVMEKNRSGKNN